ncbi:MAG: TspO/MBR family protein [Gemmatimonadota bacterium]
MSERTRDLLALGAFLAACFAVAAIGSAFTARAVDAWYAALRKPAWTPPSPVFGPVWAVLYAAMALAAWLVWREVGHRWLAPPLRLFWIQLALNLGWTAIFFGLRAPGPALLEIVVLLAFVVAAMIAFWRVTAPAGLLFVPYVIWVGYATALNAAIWRMNA